MNTHDVKVQGVVNQQDKKDISSTTHDGPVNGNFDTNAGQTNDFGGKCGDDVKVKSENESADGVQTTPRVEPTPYETLEFTKQTLQHLLNRDLASDPVKLIFNGKEYTPDCKCDIRFLAVCAYKQNKKTFPDIKLTYPE